MDSPEPESRAKGNQSSSSLLDSVCYFGPTENQIKAEKLDE